MMSRKARLDLDNKAKPLTEIVEVFPAEGKEPCGKPWRHG